jgi:hypothetical protein
MSSINKPKKKRIAPQLIAPPPPSPPPKKHAGGHKRLEKSAEGTLKDMKAAVKNHNEKYCIKLTGTRAQVKQRVQRVAKRFRDIERKGGRGGNTPAKAPAAMGGGGGTKGQKKASKKLHKLANAYGNLAVDANPNLAF